MFSPPPKKSFMSGVRNVNGMRTPTVMVFPGPAPPVAEAHEIVDPTWFAQAVVTVVLPSPRWAWTLVSWSTRVVMPTVSVGAPWPKFAPSRAALLISM